ncbi:MAG: hypothetical protein FWF05_02295 [Oscillospiraceae bacterium]|nr:hypothetical protein [Oscillospiraceae bacterium]
MKKIIRVLFSVLLTLTLCACEGGRVMDVWIFMERFNARSRELTADPASLIVIEDSGEKKYTLFLLLESGGGKIMLTLYPAPDGSITRCDITAEKPTEKAGELFSHFYAAALNAAVALTKETPENIADVLTSLKITDARSFDRAYSEYVTTHLFDYCVISNGMGISFIIENLRLKPRDTSDIPSLREK